MAVGGALFGPSSGAASLGPKALVEFRAGKMRFNEANKLVTPDERKGVLSVLIADDQLVHLQWRDRTSGSIEDDFIICPNNFELKVGGDSENSQVYSFLRLSLPAQLGECSG